MISRLVQVMTDIFQTAKTLGQIQLYFFFLFLLIWLFPIMNVGRVTNLYP